MPVEWSHINVASLNSLISSNGQCIALFMALRCSIILHSSSESQHAVMMLTMKSMAKNNIFFIFVPYVEGYSWFTPYVITT